ncbi:MAG: hypothetical protein MUO26_01065 [Methanotrichaceae archaeon]|nr:hypothetical protein [Methanotrichaceae archaeon]
MLKSVSLLYLAALIIVCQVSAMTAEIEGGWDVVADGLSTSSGQAEVGCSGGDPSVTMAIASTLSLYGPGSVSDSKVGKQNIDINIGGYRLKTSYDGDLSSKLVLNSQGSASVSSYVGATATGLTTGRMSNGGLSYDIFGSADLINEGFIAGQGLASTSASGSAEFLVQKVGTPSEVWGSVSGNSALNLDSRSSTGLASSGGAENGLHADSRAVQGILGDIKATSHSSISTYSSVINNATGTVSASGQALAGAWDPSFTGSKSRLSNENVASSAKGDLTGYVEANQNNDAADISSIIQSSASKDSILKVSGGAASYAATSQSSSALRTYAKTFIKDGSWGTVARNAKGQQVIEWGDVKEMGAGAVCYEPSDAISFSKINMEGNMTFEGNIVKAGGDLILTTYAQATLGKKSVAGAKIDPYANGTLMATDSVMFNQAGFEGSTPEYSHISYVDAVNAFALTKNQITRTFVQTEPKGNHLLAKPFRLDTTVNPAFAWSSTEAQFDQAH